MGKSKDEKATDFFVANLLKEVGIKYFSDVKDIQDALKTASKKCNGEIGKPDFIGCCRDFIILAEDKADINQQALYIDENKTILSEEVDAICDYAENGALHYAKHIAKNTFYKKIFAFGCSGNEKHYRIRPIYVDDKTVKILPEISNFENFSLSNIENYYHEQVLGEEAPEILETEEIISRSKTLHEDLWKYGQLGEMEKPLVVSAILLALQDKENFTIDMLKGLKKNKTDGEKIFEAVKNYLNNDGVQPENKKELILHQFNLIKDRKLLNQIDERLNKTPLRYFTEYIQKNVINALQLNSPEDVLGRFYSEFVRYSGGDGQSLGIVLTPSHITELFCDLVQLNYKDKVFDPCCGTAGFLVAAMSRMLDDADTNGTIDDRNKVKSEQLHGYEIREGMFSIATTNMILRGDGKSNLHCDDFLKQDVEKLRKANYTVGFMNPPYSMAKSKDTAFLSELSFIQHMLDGIGDNARCVVIVPQSTMIGKTSYDKNIKKEILKSHTLEGVITLNTDTFYRIGTNPCIAVFTAHKPHNKDKYCKFINFKDDGYTINKHIGLVKTERAKERKRELLDCWLNNKDAETKFMVKSKITAEDEWLHAFYYFNDEIPKEEDFDKTISDYLTFEFSMIAQGRGYLFKEIEE